MTPDDLLNYSFASPVLCVFTITGIPNSRTRQVRLKYGYPKWKVRCGGLQLPFGA
jgi:hypothetical protein